MREYTYDIIKNVEQIDNISERIIVNGVTLHQIDVLTFKEYHNEYIIMGLQHKEKEIASVTIRRNQKIVIDENSNSYTIAEAL